MTLAEILSTQLIRDRPMASMTPTETLCTPAVKDRPVPPMVTGLRTETGFKATPQTALEMSLQAV